MKSKDEIKSDLKLLAGNHNMSGEAVDMIIDLLTYSLYHEQVSILNTAKEMSLNDAYSINSKITLCDNVMYSVYRGTCPIVHLNCHFDSNKSYDKFELMYTSNTFYLYSLNTISEVNSTNLGDVKLVDAILTKNPMIEKEVKCTYNQYYIDLVDDVYGNTYSDISDDVMVSINGKEYKTTRLFQDHCRYDDTIFVLTIPGYGIRLYKKQMFDSGDIVNIKAIVYTRMDEINDSDIDNIKIAGIRFMEKDGVPGIDHSPEIARQDADSFLYQANFAGRVNHEIQSNSDVSYLFSEVYIKYVYASTFKYYKKGEKPYDFDEDQAPLESDRLYIRYIPRPDVGDSLSDNDFDEFRENYGSYFICDDIDISEAECIDVNLIIKVILNDNISIQDEVTNILETSYNYKLGDNVDEDQLRSDISKLDVVKCIKSFELTGYDTSIYDLNNMQFNQYVTIVPNIIYISN